MSRHKWSSSVGRVTRCSSTSSAFLGLAEIGNNGVMTYCITTPTHRHMHQIPCCEVQYICYIWNHYYI